jgi:hypothetical protein
MFVDFGKRSKAFAENKKVQIDTEDYDKHFKDKTFSLCKGYVLRNNVGIHRIIMDIVENKELQVDHINHDTLDNRRCNLRVVTPQQNAMNKEVYKNNQSGYTGCHFYKPTQKWMSYITGGGKRQHLGYFETLPEAYTAYIRAAKALHGEYAPQRIQEEDQPIEPQPRVYKSPVWARENYRKNRDEKLKKQNLRNIKRTGKTPKQSTIESNNISPDEIKEMISEHQKISKP